MGLRLSGTEGAQAVPLVSEGEVPHLPCLYLPILLLIFKNFGFYIFGLYIFNTEVLILVSDFSFFITLQSCFMDILSPAYLSEGITYFSCVY